MINQTFKLSSFAVFALLFAVAFVSSVELSVPSNDITLGDTTATVTVSVDNSEDNQTVSFSINNIVSGANIVSFESIPSVFLESGESTQVTVEADTISSGFGFGRYTTTLTATGRNDSDVTVSTDTTTITFVKSFCSNGEIGNLTLRNIDISNSGEDDEEWKPLDEITIEVDVENDGSDDVDDVLVEMGLYDSSGRNVVSDLDFTNDDEEEFDIGNIRDDERETATFEFRLPADFETGNYRLVIKAYSDDAGEDEECADTSSDLDNDFYQTISIESEDDEGKFIAFDDIRLSSDEAVCGDSVSLRTNVFNIGDEDQDQVRVNLVSSELDLDLSQEIKSGLDEGDDKELIFNFVVPQGLRDRTYSLELSAEYDYRNGVYREESDEPTLVPLTVFGCTGTTPTNGDTIAVITASLESEAVAGQEMTIRSRITNPTQNPITYVIDVKGFESWAQLSSVSARTLSINAGESQEVTIRLDVNDNASGEQTFRIEAITGQKTESRQVAVNVEGTQGSGFSLSLGNNWLIWTIGIVNVILIIIIIIVAVIVSRR